MSEGKIFQRPPTAEASGDLHSGLSRAGATSSGEMKNKRPSIQNALKRFGITETRQLSELTQGDIEQLRRDVDFFEQNPDISNSDIADYFRNGADIRNSIAESIGEDGRTALEQLKKQLPKATVN